MGSTYIPSRVHNKGTDRTVVGSIVGQIIVCVGKCTSVAIVLDRRVAKGTNEQHPDSNVVPHRTTNHGPEDAYLR